MGSIGLAIAIFFIVVFVVIAFVLGAVYKLGDRLARLRLEEVSSAVDGADKIISASESLHQWAQEHEFHFVGYFKETGFGSLLAGWQFRERPTFFCYYLMKDTRSLDFVTVFANEVGLTTGSADGGQLIPRRPGSYCQTFSQLSIDDLWARHVDMENYLIDEGGAELVRLDVSFKEKLAESMREEIGFLRQIRLWPLRAIYWYFTRRKARHNLSIQEQHKRGMIRLPKERSEK